MMNRSASIGAISPRLLVAVLVAAAGTTALAGNIQVIYTKIPGHPTAAVPGCVDITGAPTASDFRALEDLIMSPDGSAWIIKGRTQLGSELENIMIKGSGTTGAMFVQEGQPILGGAADERYEFFGSGIGAFNTNNEFAFSARARTGPTGSTSAANGQRVLTWSTGSGFALAFKQGDVIASGLVDTTVSGDETFGNSVGSIHILNNGVIGSQDSTIGAIATSRRPAIMYSTPTGGGTYTHAGFHQTGVTSIGGLTWATLNANEFFTTPDGAHWIAEGRIGADTATDGVLVRDGVAMLREGSTVAGSGLLMGDVFQAAILANGDWVARGRDITVTTPSTLAPDFAVRNGVLLAKTGDPITTGNTELWGDTFGAVAANQNGDWVLMGNTNAAEASNQVVVLNGTTVLAREGDRVDLNGNGLPDDNAFIGRANNTLVAFDANDFALTNDGFLYFIANLVDGDGVDLNSSPLFGTPQALLRLSINPGPTCGDADFDGDGDTGTDLDIEAFFACLGGDCCATCGNADFDGDGDTGTDLDIEAFFRVLGGGQC